MSDQAAGGTPPGPPRAGFLATSVHPLDWSIVGAGLLALIFSFSSYYTYTPTGSDARQYCGHLSAVPPSVRAAERDACDGIGNSAWHGLFGWLGVLAAIVGALIVGLALFVPRARMPIPTHLAALGAFVLALAGTVVALFVIPDGEYMGIAVDSGASDTAAGHGFAFWVVLAVVVIGLGLCAVRLRGSRRHHGTQPPPPQDHGPPH